MNWKPRLLLIQVHRDKVKMNRSTPLQDQQKVEQGIAGRAQIPSATLLGDNVAWETSTIS